MTTEFALQYIPRKMREQGFGDSYLIQFRHFILQANEVKEIDAGNELYLLIEFNEQVTVQSAMGIFDTNDDTIDEIIYEHQGIITIQNNSNDLTSVRFIQVIPKNKGT